MIIKDTIIRFDWAAKRMLRDKANFDVLEGLVTVLQGETVHIVELLESESNQDDPFDKFNRVDIKAKNSNDIFLSYEKFFKLFGSHGAAGCNILQQ